MAAVASSSSSGPTRTAASGSSARSKAREKQKSKERRRVTEAELKAKEVITPEDVLALGRPTETHLCPVEANIYKVAFQKFRVRHIATDTILFEIGPPEEEQNPAEQTESIRQVHYVLPVEVLKLQQLAALIEFKIGDRPIENFRMVEIHYFGERVLKVFDFHFGFCIPGSVNTCEHMYDLPDIDDETMAAMVAQPRATKSDSFYFADNKLFMHNRCTYTYLASPDEGDDDSQ